MAALKGVLVLLGLILILSIGALFWSRAYYAKNDQQALERTKVYERDLPKLKEQIAAKITDTTKDVYINDLDPKVMGLKGVQSLSIKHMAIGSLSIEFHERSGFPIQHRGILFQSDDAPANDPEVKQRWPSLKKLRNNWYLFAD